MNSSLWIKTPLFFSDHVLTEKEMITVRLLRPYVFALLTLGVGIALWIRVDFSFNPAVPFVAVIISSLLSYGIAFWRRKKLSSLSIDELSSKMRSGDRVEWSQVTRVGMKNWQLSIWTGEAKHTLSLSLSQAESVEEFIRSKTDASLKTLKTRIHLVFLGLLLLVGDMILLVETSPSWGWTAVFAGVAILAVVVGLFVYALIKPRVENS